MSPANISRRDLILDRVWQAPALRGLGIQTLYEPGEQRWSVIVTHTDGRQYRADLAVEDLEGLDAIACWADTFVARIVALWFQPQWRGRIWRRDKLVRALPVLLPSSRAPVRILARSFRIGRVLRLLERT